LTHSLNGRRILFVAMPGSIHAARWIGQLAGLGWDVRVFAATPTAVRPEFKEVSLYGVSRYRPPGLDPSTRLTGFWPLRRGAWHVGAPFRKTFAPALASLIRRFRPDVVHSLETQHAGYLTLEARKRLGRSFPTWIASNWGSDIHFFGRIPEHVEKIREVMGACDYLHAECERDIDLGRKFGFQGEVFGLFPCGAGFDLNAMRAFRQSGRTSARRTIVLKGQQGLFGRALVGLRALELCADRLSGFRIAIPLATPDVKRGAKLLLRKAQITVDVETERWPRDRVLRLHGSARTSIVLGVTDAASTSMLEAMVMGSLPIQSCTACTDEWIANGESGLVVPPEDPLAVAEAITRALTDDELVDRAAEQNGRLAAERLDERVVRPQVVARYMQVLEA